MIIKALKRGDTLIEVMLAVGIFSMVAVAVVSVMSGGTSGSQTALETSLTRQEIDNQAEALRFIQRSYIGDVRTGVTSPYGYLWSQIASKAYTQSNASLMNDDSILNYHPNNCKDLYNDTNSELHKYGFIIDPQGFADYENEFLIANHDSTKEKAAMKKILFSGNDIDSKLQPASTYPHLFYSNLNHASEADTELNDRGTTAVAGQKLYQAQGIYVVAVKDPNDTSLANKKMNTDGSGYYDFYIRTCWYGTGDQSPSTISTVIRLYNPDVITDPANATTP